MPSHSTIAPTVSAVVISATRPGYIWPRKSATDSSKLTHAISTAGITIVIHTLTPSVDATTSANVRHLRAVTGSTTAVECTSCHRVTPVLGHSSGPRGFVQRTWARRRLRVSTDGSHPDHVPRASTLN